MDGCQRSWYFRHQTLLVAKMDGQVNPWGKDIQVQADKGRAIKEQADEVYNDIAIATGMLTIMLMKAEGP
jgi:hypothetical protein